MALTKSTVPVNPEEKDTLVLQLTMYKNYTWRGGTYKEGQAYRFNRKEAMQLLQEVDAGRPIWKIYRKPVVKAVNRNIVVDATSVSMPEPVEPVHGVVTGGSGQKRIDVGTDEELTDILDRKDDDPDAGAGNITV